MSGISRRERGWLTLFVLVPLLGTAPTPLLAEEEAPETLVRRLDVYLESCAAFGWSGAALVAKDGKVLVRRGYGFADRNARRANDPNTLFEIASVTKVFTACAVLRLVEMGRLGIDDPIAQHLPGVPKDKHDITVRHLLAHTSGMSRRVGGGGSDVPAAVASYLGKARTRKAGEKLEYWNGGFALLAALIEQASGEPYAAFCAKHLFAPAGMSSSGFTGDELPQDRQAIGYDGEQPVRRAAEHPYRVYDFGYKGMGGVVTSAEDLWRFAQALWAGRVLKPETARLMQQPVVGHQGLGWGVLQSKRKTPRLVHGGAVKGFHTAYELLPQERGAIIVLSNVEGVPPWKIQWNLQSMLFGEPLRYAVPPIVVDLPDERLKALEGIYRLEGGDASLTVEQNGRGLQLGAEGNAAAVALSTSAAGKRLEPAIALTRALLDAILKGDVQVIEKALPEGVFYAKTWPRVLVEKIWPKQVETWGALNDVRLIGATPLARGMQQVVLGLRHAKGDRRLQAIFLRNGRLSRLSFEGPRFAMRRLYVPASETTFRSFDWMHDERLPEVSFATESEKRRVLLVNHPSGSTARFVRE